MGLGGAGVAAVGVVIAGTQVFGPGDPSPQAVRSPAVPRGVLAAQQPLPAGTSIVRRRLVLPAGSAPLGAAVGSVRLDQPVRVLRRSGGWSRVSTDAGRTGWVRSAALRALPERTP